MFDHPNHPDKFPDHLGDYPNNPDDSPDYLGDYPEYLVDFSYFPDYPGDYANNPIDYYWPSGGLSRQSW